MTISQVKRLCQQIGLRPQIAAGQNFLLSEKIIEQMIESADVTAADKILEIGPGLGILTDALIGTGAKVVAVEIDTRLNNYLQNKYQGQKNLSIIHQDIFRVNLPDHFTDRGYKLVANLPYSSTGLTLRNFLTLSPRPSSLTIMIQYDVAERILAEPGQMSLAALMVQYYGSPMFIESLTADNFWPKPKVRSAIVRIDVKDWPAEEITRRVWQLARAGFATRRKQLHSSLAAIWRLDSAEVKNRLVKLGLSADVRPQELSIDNWLKLASIIS